MRVLDLFSGIGGFSLGLERAGMTTVAFCEAGIFQRAVLRKHWPDVPQYVDVRELGAMRLRADGIGVDLICGGFPCQDISSVGRKVGITGKRSRLWVEYVRLIREIRPRYVIVENVSALLGRGLDVVLGDLAEIGYDAEWSCLPTGLTLGHRRERVFIVAYPARGGCDLPVEEGLRDIFTLSQFDDLLVEASPEARYTAGPFLLRALHGISRRMDRVEALGNVVIPAVVERIGRAIIRIDKGYGDFK